MGDSDVDRPVVRVLLVAGLALLLLAAPLWVAWSPLGEQTYRYDRAEVVTTSSGIEYAADEDVPADTPISESVECGGWEADVRICALERRVLDEGSVPTGVYTTGTTVSSSSFPGSSSYQYVQLEDGLYRATFVVNESVSRGGAVGMSLSSGANADRERVNRSEVESYDVYRVDAVLEPADTDRALEDVAVPVDRHDHPALVTRTASTGPTTSRTDVEPPQAPIQLENGSYYRVYQERGSDDPHVLEWALAGLLAHVGPVLGLGLLGHVWRRTEVRYRGVG